MILSRIAAVTLVVASSVACRTTTTSSPPGLADAVVLRSHAVRAWDLVDATTAPGSVTPSSVTYGSVVRFEEPGTKPRAWFSVRNTYSQEVGIVDVEGRAWRYRPHQREPEWLGTGTVRDGVARILGAAESAQLVEVSLDEIAARG